MLHLSFKPKSQAYSLRGQMVHAWLNMLFNRVAAVLCLAFASAPALLANDDANSRPAPDAPLIIRFKAEPRSQSQVVRVGDLVEIVSGRAGQQDWLEIPLAPAPPVGSSQDWTSADMLRHLELRGVMLKQIRWSGPESVRLLRIAEPVTPIDSTQLAPAFVQDRTLTQAEANVIQATREYLWLKTGERTEWRVTVKIPLEHANALSQRRNIENVAGGVAPWSGEQRLVFGYKHHGKSLRLELTVQIELPETVVVAARPIRRDEVVDASALTYAPLPDRLAEQGDEYFVEIEQLVGKQLRRSLSTGLPVAKSAVSEPTVISTGELIEIEAVSGAVSVKTAARALSAGAVGDPINVEVLSNRQRLTATVVGPLQVRVAGSAHVSQAPVTLRPVPTKKAERTAASLAKDGIRR